jgi:hypothetical protein
MWDVTGFGKTVLDDPNTKSAYKMGISWISSDSAGHQLGGHPSANKIENPRFSTLGLFDSPNATYHSVNPHDRREFRPWADMSYRTQAHQAKLPAL